MTLLKIKRTEDSPEIVMNPENGEISVIGKSYPENAFEFYEPIMEWLSNYFKNPQEKTTINFEVIYFNSSSSKLFFELFDLLNENNLKSNIQVNWIYDKGNDSALEFGKDFKEDFQNLDFNLVKK